MKKIKLSPVYKAKILDVVLELVGLIMPVCVKTVSWFFTLFSLNVTVHCAPEPHIIMHFFFFLFMQRAESSAFIQHAVASSIFKSNADTDRNTGRGSGTTASRSGK